MYNLMVCGACQSVLCGLDVLQQIPVLTGLTTPTASTLKVSDITTFFLLCCVWCTACVLQYVGLVIVLLCLVAMFI